MSRKRRGDPVHGWLSIDKPPGRTSANVVAEVKRLFSAQKAGHGGTLDPMATGVLPIAFGEATKTVEYVMRGSKTYRFSVCWGEARDTDDLEGTVVGDSDVRPDAAAIDAILPQFVGDIEQIPPAFSAIKLHGRRAYELARNGEVPKLTARNVSIYECALESVDDRDHASFRVVCGKGTYVRSLGRDIAAALGTLAHISRLRRCRVGPFDETQAISLDSLKTLMHSSARSQMLLPVEVALADIPAIALTQIQAEKLRHGETVNVESSEIGLRCAMASGHLIALAEVADGRVRPKRVFNL